jgi:hypothetical protein
MYHLVRVHSYRFDSEMRYVISHNGLESYHSAPLLSHVSSPVTRHIMQQDHFARLYSSLAGPLLGP